MISKRSSSGKENKDRLQSTETANGSQRFLVLFKRGNTFAKSCLLLCVVPPSLPGQLAITDHPPPPKYMHKKGRYCKVSFEYVVDNCTKLPPQ